MLAGAGALDKRAERGDESSRTGARLLAVWRRDEEAALGFNFTAVFFGGERALLIDTLGAGAAAQLGVAAFWGGLFFAVGAPVRSLARARVAASSSSNLLCSSISCSKRDMPLAADGAAVSSNRPSCFIVSRDMPLDMAFSSIYPSKSQK